MIFYVKSLTYGYTKGKNVLENVNFSLEEGEILTVLGPNGAGKSTLLHIMTGLFKPLSGEVLLENSNICSLKENEIAKKISFVPQSVDLTFSYTVEDYILMGRAPLIKAFSMPSKADREAVNDTMKEMKISHLADKFITQISGGERQQVTIARAVVRNPKAILFDEPTAHLDFANQLKVLRMINELSKKGYAIIFTTHNPDHAIILGGNTAILDNYGKLIKGKTEEIVTEDVLKNVYKTELLMRYIEEIDRFSVFYPKL